MLAAVSLRYPIVFAHICINIDFTIFFPKNKWKNWLSHTRKHKNRHIIYVSSVIYVVAKLFVNMLIFMYFGGHLGFRHFRLFLDL